eukprot:12005721-Prorocentrum_lima.AAC.1
MIFTGQLTGSMQIGVVVDPPWLLVIGMSDSSGVDHMSPHTWEHSSSSRQNWPWLRKHTVPWTT